jgi:hypothetical protein
MAIQGARRRAAVALIAAAAVTGVGTAVAQPALASVSSYYLHANTDYSYATITVKNGTIGRAYAQHGNLSALSPWYNSYAWAYADSGWSNSYRATVQWIW